MVSEKLNGKLSCLQVQGANSARDEITSQLTNYSQLIRNYSQLTSLLE